jgi:hypothetical protein
MPLVRRSQLLPVPWLFCLLVSAVLVSGCRRNVTPQLAVVQALANDLGVAKSVKKRLGCSLLVEAQRDLLMCDGALQTLLHYAPAFPGSRVTPSAPPEGGFWGRPMRLPVRYKGPLGEGSLDVHLRLEGKDWRIFALVPR